MFSSVYRISADDSSFRGGEKLVGGSFGGANIRNFVYMYRDTDGIHLPHRMILI